MTALKILAAVVGLWIAYLIFRVAWDVATFDRIGTL